MTRKKKMSTSVGAGMTAKQLRRKKPYNISKSASDGI